MNRRTHLVLLTLVGLLAFLTTAALVAHEQPAADAATTQLLPVETALNADGTIRVPEWTLPTETFFGCPYTCEECLIACGGQPSCEQFCIMGPCAMGC